MYMKLLIQPIVGLYCNAVQVKIYPLPVLLKSKKRVAAGVENNG